MSMPFLSRQDIESWVPEAVASKGTADFVAKLCTAISKAIASLKAILTGLQDEACRICQNELERFLLWCQGLGVADGRLDEVLARSKELHHQVLSLLLRLGTAILQAISHIPDPPSQLQLDNCDHLRTMLDIVDTMLEDTDSERHVRAATPSGSETSDYGLMDVMEEISVYVDCLLDLAPALDNPVFDILTDDPEEPLPGVKESFTTSCEEAFIYCRKIRDRFDALPKYLVERLAEANVVRASMIREMQRQVLEKEKAANDSIAESLFSGKHPQVTETSKSSAPATSIFSSALASSSKWLTRFASAGRHVSSAEFDDNISEATFASFSTTASSIAMGRPRMPPMPDMQDGGFDCTVCQLHLTDVTTRKQWKKHLFGDLKPYVCTAEGCQASGTLFAHSGTWAKHESSHPPATPIYSECPFCSANYQALSPSYYKHVSSHLREVSLSALPRMTSNDESGTDDTDDTDSLPSNHSLKEEEAQPSPPALSSDEDYFTSWPRIVDSDSDDGTESQTPREARVFPQEYPSIVIGALTNESQYLDAIIDQLLNARHLEPGASIDLPSLDVEFLCTNAREILLSQPMLLELDAPLSVVGDIHGRLNDLLKLMELTGFPPEQNYVFLGNYVNDGEQSVEVMCLLLAYKIKYPENFFLLRGNHETALLTRKYGFYQECKRRYSPQLWKSFVDMFNCMPVAAVVKEKILCVHGGLSPRLNSLKDINNIRRPTDVLDNSILYDLLWNDPDAYIVGWIETHRNGPLHFGADVVSRFVAKHGVDLIVRGHEVRVGGFDFFSKRQLVTIWSNLNWKGLGNSAATMSVNESLLCSFKVLEPNK